MCFTARPVGTQNDAQVPAVLDVETSHMVRILFMFTWNGRAWRQVKRLFKQLYHVNHYYYIHVDVVCIHVYVHCSTFPYDTTFSPILYCQLLNLSIWAKLLFGIIIHNIEFCFISPFPVASLSPSDFIAAPEYDASYCSQMSCILLTNFLSFFGERARVLLK